MGGFPSCRWIGTPARCCVLRLTSPDHHLRGGEPVELINLTPNGKLTFILPEQFLTFQTQIGNRLEDHRGWLSSVIIEPITAASSWSGKRRSRFGADVDYLEETAVSESPENLSNDPPLRGTGRRERSRACWPLSSKLCPAARERLWGCKRRQAPGCMPCRGQCIR